MAKAKTSPPTEPTPAAAEPQAGEIGKATTTHVLGLVTLFLGPLAMYFIFRRKSSPWLRAHLDEAINYHLLVVIAFVVLIGLAVLFTSAFNMGTVALVLLLLAVLVFILNIVFSILAIIQAGRGRSFHFPLDVKIVR
jgi:uncharacterized Tic20 family protein